MEASAILKMVEDAFYNLFFIIDAIVSDNGSTMWAVIKHQSKGARGQALKQSKVKLDTKIPEPSFLADLSHRVKVVENIYSPSPTKVGISDAGAPKQIPSESRNIGGKR